MKSEGTTPKAALKPWRASVFRKKLQRMGRVWATDRTTAEAVEEVR